MFQRYNYNSLWILSRGENGGKRPPFLYWPPFFIDEVIAIYSGFAKCDAFHILIMLWITCGSVISKSSCTLAEQFTLLMMSQKRQASLLNWSTKAKKGKVQDSDRECKDEGRCGSSAQEDVQCSEKVSASICSEDSTIPSSALAISPEIHLEQRECKAQCCSTYTEVFQPTDQATVSGLASKNRNFLPKWYKEFPWLTVCITRKKSVLSLLLF